MGLGKRPLCLPSASPRKPRPICETLAATPSRHGARTNGTAIFLGQRLCQKSDFTSHFGTSGCNANHSNAGYEARALAHRYVAVTSCVFD
jgi:hypothetical protein